MKKQLGEKLYVFKCGCISYEIEKRVKGIAKCAKHIESLKEIHIFCGDCGLHIVNSPMGRQKKYCNYQFATVDGYGNPVYLMGCAAIRMRDNVRAASKRRHAAMSKIKKPNVKRRYVQNKMPKSKPQPKKVHMSGYELRLGHRKIKKTIKNIHPIPKIPDCIMLNRLFVVKQLGG